MALVEPGIENPLSMREMEVAVLAASGWSNKEIAHELRNEEGKQLSRQTIKNHMANIFAKLNCRDRQHMMLFLLIYGWVTLPDLARNMRRWHPREPIRPKESGIVMSQTTLMQRKLRSLAMQLRHMQAREAARG